MEQSHDALMSLLERLKIKEFDLILIGDGSGSMQNYPIGWACVAIEQGQMSRRVFYGGANDGTINQAEPLAYLIPLSWYAAKLNKEGKPGARGVRHIHIITDSEYARDQGQRLSVTTSYNTILWAAFGLLARQGLVLHWHWIERETDPVNHEVDLLSKAARALIKDTPLTPESP